MNPILASALQQTIEAAISSAFDPNPIVFKDQHEVGVVPVRSACTQSSETFVSFKHELNRNAFLCGCLDYTEHEVVEHLIVGIGYRHGSTTKVTGLIHAVGTTNSVDVSANVQSIIQAHLRSDNDAEVLVFHNHPDGKLRTMLNNTPIASVGDRNMLVANALSVEQIMKRISGGGTYRCYLGENGFVREFRTPNVFEMFREYLQ